METERDHSSRATDFADHLQHEGPHASFAEQYAGSFAIHALARGMLHRSGVNSRGRGNAATRAAATQHLQHTYGNRAIQRCLQRPPSSRALSHTPPTVPVLQRAPDTATGEPTTQAAGAAPGQAQANAPAPVAAPTENYVVPFDHNPQSLPGEQILFNDVFDHAQPALFQLVFTGTGGKFGSASGSANKTIPGLNSGNLPFFIDANWDGRSAVSVTLEVQKVADHTAVRNYTWTFSKKTHVPTTIQQQETEDERPLPSTYSYKVGPALNRQGNPDYEHGTILETFGSNSCNIAVADLKPAFRTAHPELTNDAQITSYFFGGSGSNGTFTVDHDDKIYDQHGGGMPEKATFEEALTRMKEIHVDLPQTYSAKSGTPLGTYTIRRILKTDGSMHLKKMKT